MDCEYYSRKEKTILYELWEPDNKGVISTSAMITKKDCANTILFNVGKMIIILYKDEIEHFLDGESLSITTRDGIRINLDILQTM